MRLSTGNGSGADVMVDPYYDEFVRILTAAGASEAEAKAHADMWVTAARAAGQRIRLERERDEALDALALRVHATKPGHTDGGAGQQSTWTSDDEWRDVVALLARHGRRPLAGCNPSERERRLSTERASDEGRTQTCGQVGIGHGGDTWDPVCDLPAGHAGRCNWSGTPTPPQDCEEVGGHCGCERVCGDLPAEQDRELTICRGLLPQRLGARRERDAARTALAALIDAGEPFIESAFPGEQMAGEGLRLYNRWLAAMNDARHAIGSTHEGH